MADFGFVVDSSGSLKNEYNIEKEFVQAIVDTFKLSTASSSARAALVLFSRTAHLEIKFSDYANTAAFKAAVAKLPLLGSTTRIDKALQVAYKEMFNVSNGARKGIQKVLILMTDGKQTVEIDSVDLALAIKPIHEAGIKVIVIGIGPGVDPVELASIAEDPKDIYYAKDFNQLRSSNFITNITEASCALPGEYCALFVIVKTFNP